MKHLLKSFVLVLATTYIAYRLIPTVDFGNDPQTIIFFLGGLWVITQIVNPIFSIILLPVNLITFGLVSFIFNTAFIFALINYLPNFTIAAYNSPAANVAGFIIPALNLTQLVTVIVFALIITLTYKFLHLIFE